ncbi:MAG: phage baseplate assembly protein V [Bacteroides sp.]|nr:phage baseplate assembly protein V [Bacteroides sp.]
MDLNTVETHITVDGKPCDFITMNLDQYVTGHHTFAITVSHRHEKESVWAITVDEIFRQYLNKKVYIGMKHRESGEMNEFEGIVTDIEVAGVDGDKGTVVLRGGSPTLLLDRDPGMASFTEYTLYNVVAETIEHTGIDLEIENKIQLERPIPYLARYKETSYAFLSRVLADFGEWCYYDGRKLVVGNPMNQQEKRVTFDMELLEVRSKAGVRNLNTRYYDYDPTENSYFEEASATISNANLAMKTAKQIADELYPNPYKLPVGRTVLGETDISNVVRTRQNRVYTQTSEFTARCNSCGIRIGEIATVFLPDMPEVSIKDLGSFRVTEIHHQVDKEGQYENTFTGITALTETLPDDHIVAPQAFPEPAIVVDNDDPREQGRVKVRFFWQAEDESTDWVRVQTPDAGSSDVVAANRGFVFIPEIEDQVMVGFQYGDPSRPYVMGSLFHRDNSEGAAASNSVKSITTRSGSVLRFTDLEEENAYKIELRYNEDNGIVLTVNEDEGTLAIQTSKDIYIKAPELIQFEAKNIILLAEETIQAKADDKIEMVAENNLHLESADQMELMGADITAEAQSELGMSGKNITAKADSSLALNGGSKMDVKAGTIKMNQ